MRQILAVFSLTIPLVYVSALRISTRLFTAMKDNDQVMNKYSRVITEPPSQGASQAMLYATGLTPESIHKPQVSLHNT